MRSFLPAACGVAIVASVLKLFRLYNSLDEDHVVPAWKNYSRSLDFDELVADDLKRKVRLLCWIMTSPRNHKSKAAHIRDTWGKRCSVLVFMTTKYDPDLPVVVLPVKDGRGRLWKKSQEALKYIYKNYLDSVDWILKADDDTLFFPENARYLLSRYNPNEPLWLGCKMKMIRTPAFLSGGAGYIFSKEAVKVFVEKALQDDKYCQPDLNDWADDLRIGKCFERLGVKLVDTRDENGLHRFLPLSPEFNLAPFTNETKDSWWWYATFYKDQRFFGGECCSSTAVSFHYVGPIDLHIYYNLVYNIRPWGISFNDTLDGLPAFPPDATLKQRQFFNREANERRRKADVDFFRNMFKHSKIKH